MVREAQRTAAPVYLTLAHLDAEFVRGRFPTIVRACAQAGFDLARDRIPVSPAAHYVMGGVETDLDGRTSLPGLFAAGEVACTGVHGANRLASNSLLEGLVFGARAADAMRAVPAAADMRASEVVAWRPASDGAADLPPAEDVRELMWRHVGLLRDRDGLQGALARLESWMSPVIRDRRSCAGEPSRCRVANLVTVGLLMARAALRREESCGAHFRTDFPARDDLHWKRHIADVLNVQRD
jgi:L-aspartate oxidase